MNNNQRGYLLTEFLIVMAISTALLAYAIPKVGALSKAVATKHEMKLLSDVIQLHEAVYGTLPVSLSSLCPAYYQSGANQDKDEFGVNYQYNVGPRTICSTSFSPSYCQGF